jgi:two-component system, NarL family, sensor histidine kinase UhpB
VKLVIEDDGVGISFKPKAARQTFGMTGMRERMANVGGTMKVTSTRGKGTRIEVSAPASTGAAGVEQLAFGRPHSAARGA